MCSQLCLEERVFMLTLPLQSFDPGSERYDLILLHNCINYLNEAACIHLLESEVAKKAHLAICAKLATIAADGATVIICDCSRYN
jgi:hypothetical protein